MSFGRQARRPRPLRSIVKFASGKLPLGTTRFRLDETEPAGVLQALLRPTGRSQSAAWIANRSGLIGVNPDDPRHRLRARLQLHLNAAIDLQKCSIGSRRL